MTELTLKTDQQVVALVDEAKHRLKAGLPYSPLREDFVRVLDEFIKRHGLDWDPHSFARLPVDAIKKLELK